MESKPKTNLLARVADYYSEKLSKYGEKPQGVDWNGEKSQYLRFGQLCKIIDKNNFSINDIGCGYGALVDFLKFQGHIFSYVGFDISEKMIQTAIRRYACQNKVHFYLTSKPNSQADFCVASGIFNVRLNISDDVWKDYIYNTLGILDHASLRGFAFNCLTSYSDKDKKRDHLYYADPCVTFDFCKRNFSRHVALLHDYGLYEFTILVRKNL